MVAVPELGGGAEAFVKRSADDPVMIHQPQRLVSDDLLELILGCRSARHIGGAGFGRNVVPPVPAQCVIVDRKLASGSLDRGARRQKSFDPHAFGMITTLASPGERSLSSCHLFPREVCA